MTPFEKHLNLINNKLRLKLNLQSILFRIENSVNDSNENCPENIMAYKIVKFVQNQVLQLKL